MSTEKFATEIISLPSGGWFYPESSPLSSGELELRYMTAYHEDILTSSNLIKKGIVIDRLLDELIVDKKVKSNDFLIGDRNAVMIAARILGYGKMYRTRVECPECATTSEVDINLEELTDKDIALDPAQKGRNEFSFTLPVCQQTITFKLLTYGDEKDVQLQLESMRKNTKSEISEEVTTRMTRAIISFDGTTDRAEVARFVKNMPSRDARAFREYSKTINPNIDLTFDFDCPKCGTSSRVEVPIDSGFFWPQSTV